jgi:hypothetical protein
MIGLKAVRRILDRELRKRVVYLEYLNRHPLRILAQRDYASNPLYIAEEINEIKTVQTMLEVMCEEPKSGGDLPTRSKET